MPDHRRLDERVTNLRLEDVGDYATLISAQYFAYAAIANSLAAPRALVSRRLELAEADLNALGRTIPGRPFRCPDFNHGLGPTYVIAGSHFGAREILSRLAGSPHGDFSRAANLLGDPDLASDWAECLAALHAISPTGIEADDIVRSARLCFEEFETALAEAAAEIK